MLTSRRLQLGLLVGAALVLVLPIRAAEVDQYLPEDAEVVLVVNAKQLLDSPLVKKHFLEQMRDLMKTNTEVANILSALGFDPYKELTSLTEAMTMIVNAPKGL